MLFNPLEMFYRLFRRPNTARSAPVSSGGAAASPVAGSADTAPHSPPVGPSASGPVSQPSNSSAASSIPHGGDRRAFDGEERYLEHPHAPRHYPLSPETDAELLVLLCQQFSITSVVITHYRVKENYVEYVIECVRGHDAWRVYRRYQQFKALDHDLKQLCSSRHGSSHGAYGVVPVLPGSHWMDVTNQSPELVEQRRRYLEIYLQQLLVAKNLFYVARTPLYDFLHDGEVPTHVKLTGIQPLLGLISTRAEFVDEDCDDDGVDSGRSGQHGSPPTHLPPPRSPPPFPVSAEAADGAASSLSARQLLTAVGSPAESIVSDSLRDVQPGAAVAARSTPSSPPLPIAALDATMPPMPARVTVAVASGDEAAGEDRRGLAAREEPEVYRDDGEAPRHAKKHAHTLVEAAGFTSTVDSMMLNFADERLPPPSANCLQCNAEFNSFLYPHRCFFCRVQFCSSCLQKLSLLEGSTTASPSRRAAAGHASGGGGGGGGDGDGDGDGEADGDRAGQGPAQTSAPASPSGGRTVFACRQCSENYSRRLDRCGTAPGGGAYRGMQSTLGPTTRSSPSSSPSMPTATPGMHPRGCVGEERSSLMLQRRLAASPAPHPSLSSPTGSVSARSGAVSPIGFHDFQLLTVIGRGTFGKVLKVQMRATHQVYAMKIMNKVTVYRRCMTSYMKEEKAILTGMRPHPYIVRCHYAFQTEYYLVFVMDYLPGGELYDYIYPKLRLSPEAARVYAAELVLALECLHHQDVVHRDLKPENIVLTADGHICLTDFGLARRAFSRSRRRSFVGSPEYVAPETIQGQVQTAAVDWWSFGVMLYEMLAGKTPFHARNNNTVYDNVLHKELALPVCRADDGAGGAAGLLLPPPPPPSAATFSSDGAPAFRGFSPEAASLLAGLLARDPSMRLQDANTIKRHPFFRGLNWDDVRRRRVPAPCVPGDMRDNDVRHFKREFVSEWASVPPLTAMTRASIESLTKCFDNFPVSRPTTVSPPESATAAAVASSTSSSAAQHHHGEARALSLSLTLPPSVLATEPPSTRVPVHFSHSMTEAQRHFHGTWRIVSIEAHALEDGRVIFPWGGDVSGILVYSAGGRYSLQLSPGTRRLMGPVQRVTQLSKEELCDTYCSYVSSFGRFHILPSSMDDGCGVVRHCAEGNLCPNLMAANTVLQYRMEAEPRPTSATATLALYTKRKTSTGSGTASARTPHTSEGDSRGAGSASGSWGGVEEAEGVGAAGDDAAAPASVEERRLLLRLSTRPQRATDQDFLAFTSLLFEKV